MAWNIKRFSNDELRQRFIGMLVPQAEVLGVTLPDPELRWDASTDRWHTSEIDWSELKDVIAGRGAMNAERIRNRRNAHEDGAWVREAAAEYARKQAIRVEREVAA
jgi:ring-1,2-phenylacetyl-CoA epoxidase subunit PaaA